MAPRRTSERAGIAVSGPPLPVSPQILTPDALAFVQDLHVTFEARRRELLEQRRVRQGETDGGALPDFLAETADVREADWTVAPIPGDLQDRRVEITGPVDRKMIINALNSGANVYMADFEDSNAPTWSNTIEGQANLRDAVRRTIAFTNPDGKHYQLNDDVATLMVRPRGWHLDEKHVTVGAAPVSASLFDFGLFLFHNGEELVARGTGPYFYLPKLENHLEARLWNDVFVHAQDVLGLPRGTIRATVLIEHILAAFEMHEILWELRDHSAGLNCGRWDYIFSFIKTFKRRPEFVLPDRALVTMDRAFLEAYVELLIQTCHRREIHAMGGMAAQIPIKHDPDANERALRKVRDDKLREVKAGHDGTWVAHPGLVPIAREIFDEHMPTPHQIARKRADVTIAAADLLCVPEGPITEHGLRQNVDVGIQYLASWLGGSGCVPIYHLMEDAATAEISRSQVWQWVAHGATLDDGRPVTKELVRGTIADVVRRLKEQSAADATTLDVAAGLFDRMMTSDELDDWLTVLAYERLA